MTANQTDQASKSSQTSRFSNPMDWKAIDRFILLGSLVLLAPLLFAISILVVLWVAPSFLNSQVAYALTTLYAAHVLVMLGFIAVALKKRHKQEDWPMFENFIVGSFTAVVMLSGYATGSHFSEGLLLLFLGVNITSALAHVKKIRFLFWCVVTALVCLGINDLFGWLEHAPLLERSLYQPDGTPHILWWVVQAVMALILSALIYLCLLAVGRWVERENLYREMSTIDGLTRLTNRSSFIKRGDEELARLQRLPSDPSPTLACIMLDLDHFKSINDTWGHHAGDEVLVVASKIMMDNARQYDEVGRYGGEEFAILLPSVDLALAEKIAERLRKKISEAVVKVDGKAIQFTASLGVASFPSEGLENMNDLLKAADAALYEAKEGGRNQVVTAKRRA
ncbi:diguanylate cyclase [gamma proteobacterium HTCC5015]|nr:diguanylate cyclase [gamma proteobacterium HTCC5015]